MFRFLMIMLWAWGYIFSRFIIWPRRKEGLTWLPTLNASSWYRITDMKYKIPHKYLPAACIFTFAAAGVTFLSITHNDFEVIAMLYIHIVNSIWWPAFFELKIIWKKCLLLIGSSYICALVLCHIDFSILPTIIIQTWMFTITAHAYFVVKTPTTSLEYETRESRILEV